MLNQTEEEFMAQVMELARARNWKVYHPYDSRRSSYGYPDLTMVRPPRVIFMELKSEKGQLDIKQRYSPKTGRALPNQKDWKDAFESCPGVEYYLWRPTDWEDLVKVLR